VLRPLGPDGDPAQPLQRVTRVDRPSLRLIDQATWDAAQAKLAELLRIYGQKPDANASLASTHFCTWCGFSRSTVRSTPIAWQKSFRRSLYQRYVSGERCFWHSSTMTTTS
jgi:hypothetical protein